MIIIIIIIIKLNISKGGKGLLLRMSSFVSNAVTYQLKYVSVLFNSLLRTLLLEVIQNSLAIIFLSRTRPTYQLYNELYSFPLVAGNCNNSLILISYLFFNILFLARIPNVSIMTLITSYSITLSVCIYYQPLCIFSIHFFLYLFWTRICPHNIVCISNFSPVSLHKSFSYPVGMEKAYKVGN